MTTQRELLGHTFRVGNVVVTKQSLFVIACVDDNWGVVVEDRGQGPLEVQTCNLPALSLLATHIYSSLPEFVSASERHLQETTAKDQSYKL